MTISSLCRADAVGNNSTPIYAFGFKIFNKTQVMVVVHNTTDPTAVDIPLTLGTDFTIPDAAVFPQSLSGGSITLVNAAQAWLTSGNLTTGWSISIIRTVPLTQNTSFANQASFFAATHENAFDYMMMALLEENQTLERTFSLPLSVDPSTFNLTLPSNLAANPGAMFIVNNAGNGFTLGPSASQIVAAQGYAAAALVSQLAAAASATAAASSATSATASSTSATSSASAASTSATNAATSATAAAASAASVLSSQAANKVLAGPTSGGAANPAYRLLVPADLPVLTGYAAGAGTVAGTDTILAGLQKIDGNAQSAMSIYKTLVQTASSHIAGKIAGTYILAPANQLAAAATGILYPITFVNIQAADYPTINGIAPKLRMALALATNSTAPTGNFTLGLYPITNSNGTAGVIAYSLGTVVAGSNGATFTAPAATSFAQAYGADFALPADGLYVMAIVTTATVATSSLVHVTASLQMRNH